MDMLLGGFAFAAFVLGQVAAGIVVYGEGQRRAAEAASAQRRFRSTSIIAQS